MSCLLSFFLSEVGPYVVDVSLMVWGEDMWPEMGLGMGEPPLALGDYVRWQRGATTLKEGKYGPYRRNRCTERWRNFLKANISC